MIKVPDIKQKVESDFGDQASQAFQLINEAIAKSSHLNQPRIIRCIVFLANKDLHELQKAIEMAIVDPRDVMLGAEYTGADMDDLKRVRDFNQTFDSCEIK